MIKKILVAIEYDDTSNDVFKQAITLAQALHAQLNLINVSTPREDISFSFSPYSDQDWRLYAETYREGKMASFKLLERLAEQAKATGIEAECAQAIGSPGPAICQLAKSWGADLLMVGSHGRRGFSEMLLGSVSNYVVHHATCSVMVVHEPDRADAGD
ncbi:MAG: universal stress protein [Cyanobacteria bacterium P01_C01_bin.70]